VRLEDAGATTSGEETPAPNKPVAALSPGRRRLLGAALIVVLFAAALLVAEMRRDLTVVGI
jgi:hypothetical protein